MAGIVDSGGGYLAPVVKAALSLVPNLPAVVASAPATRTIVQTHPSTSAAAAIIQAVAPYVAPAPSTPAASLGGYFPTVSTPATGTITTPQTSPPVDVSHNLSELVGAGVPYTPPPPPPPVDVSHNLSELTGVGVPYAPPANPLAGYWPTVSTPATGTSTPLQTSSPTSFTPTPLGSPGPTSSPYNAPRIAPSPIGSTNTPSPVSPIGTPFVPPPHYQTVFGTPMTGVHNAYGQLTPPGVMHGTLEDILAGMGVMNHVQYGPELTGLSGYGGTITPNGTPAVLSAWQRANLDPTSIANYGDYVHSIAGWSPEDLAQYSQRITGNVENPTLPRNYAPIGIQPSPGGG